MSPREPMIDPILFFSLMLMMLTIAVLAAHLIKLVIAAWRKRRISADEPRMRVVVRKDSSNDR